MSYSRPGPLDGVRVLDLMRVVARQRLLGEFRSADRALSRRSASYTIDGREDDQSLELPLLFKEEWRASAGVITNAGTFTTPHATQAPRLVEEGRNVVVNQPPVHEGSSFARK